jgi:hypothetical protein
MRALSFSTTSALNMSHSKNNWARYDQKCTFVFHIAYRYCCPIWMKLEFFDSFFEKY